MKDKERYKAEMENYREKQRMGQVISDAVPLQQRLPGPDVEMVEAGTGTEEVEGDSPQSPCNESSSGKSDSEDLKDTEASSASGAAGESSNENMGTEGPPGPMNVAENTGEKVKKGQGGKVEQGPEAAATRVEGRTGKVDGNGEGVEMKVECKEN